MIRPSVRNPARAALAAALLPAVLALAACASGQAQPNEAGSPVKAVVESLGMATTPEEPAAFVKASRPAQTDYLPVGVTPPPRGVKPRTPEQLQALERELAATRARNQVQGR